ncbi:hypothetical protein ACHQM5_007261 [Ranunculus cassubicifolius]
MSEGGGRREEMAAVRKGPWAAEEDEILMDYVKKHGPRDWSSIRSKGLLPRTGKSCRLRWVNKLKPNLKTGCKFSAEEERVVLDLQARFGNKWARIATYLPGRTDNDVKNFWSTRKKRLARLSQMSNQPKQAKSNGKQTACLSSVAMEEEASVSQVSFIENSPERVKMVPLPGLMNPNLCAPQLEYSASEKKPFLEPHPLSSFPQLPQTTMDLPLLPEVGQDFVSGLDDTGSLVDVFGREETSGLGLDGGFNCSVDLPFLGLGNGSSRNCGNPATPDTLFDDFPTDVFDYIESLPNSSEW